MLSQARALRPAGTSICTRPSCAVLHPRLSQFPHSLQQTLKLKPSQGPLCCPAFSSQKSAPCEVAVAERNFDSQPTEHREQKPWQLASAAVGASREKVVLGYAGLLGLASFFGSSFSLEGPGSVAQALAVLAAIVTVHECGHFVAARWQGIHVTQFAIGFGPALYTYKGKVVEYSLRAIPLGGYVAFPDDDAKSTYDPKDPDLLKNRSIPERGLVISAGVLANIVFAYTVLLLQIGTVGKVETAYLPGVKIIPEATSSAAAKAGFQKGDIILKVGEYTVAGSPDQVTRTVAEIRASPAKELDFVIKRGAETLQVPCVPDVSSDGSGKIGIKLSSNVYINHIRPSSSGELLGMASSEFVRLGSTVVNGLKMILTNFDKMAGSLSGPVAIVAAGSEIARTDSAGIFQFCAIVNINLAVVNLLPLPALDGGYLLLLAVEALRGGQKLPEKIEQGVMNSGLLLLLVMGIGLVIKDTLKLL